MTSHAQFVELLDAAKAANGLTSDLQLDDALKQQGQVYRWRKGFTVPSKDKAVALAELAGRAPREVLDLVSLIEAERSNQVRAAAVYRAALTTLTVLLVAPLMPDLSSYLDGQTGTAMVAGGVYYGKLIGAK